MNALRPAGKIRAGRFAFRAMNRTCCAASAIALSLIHTGSSSRQPAADFPDAIGLVTVERTISPEVQTLSSPAYFLGGPEKPLAPLAGRS
jgi:hypothetical protein